jgi:hypothetical protein
MQYTVQKNNRKKLKNKTNDKADNKTISKTLHCGFETPVNE